MTTVINVKKAELNKRGIKDFEEWSKMPNSVYIGRNMNMYVKGTFQSKWHNPYNVKTYGLEKCLELYEKHIYNTPDLLNNLHELKGKELGCWCVMSNQDKTKCHCHGEILVKLMNIIV
jgi:hypothetical protein